MIAGLERTISEVDTQSPALDLLFALRRGHVPDKRFEDLLESMFTWSQSDTESEDPLGDLRTAIRTERAAEENASGESGG